MKIFKYLLKQSGDQMIEMPQGAVVLYVHSQQGQPMIWAKVDPNAPKVQRRFAVYGTGHEMSEQFRHYVGTFMMEDGTYVFHVYTDQIEYPV